MHRVNVYGAIGTVLLCLAEAACQSPTPPPETPALQCMICEQQYANSLSECQQIVAPIENVAEKFDLMARCLSNKGYSNTGRPCDAECAASTRGG
jgi:hypothetical protein